MQMRRQLDGLHVRSLSRKAATGFLDLGHARIKCALGRSGRKAIKREGDGATPIGEFCVLSVFFRNDRTRRPSTSLPVRILGRNDGWCDASGDRNYNRRVILPYSASAETMWRNDRLYDLVGVLNYNIHPRMQGRGSAIFFHLVRDGYQPTEGCIAVSAKDAGYLMRVIGPRTKICIR